MGSVSGRVEICDYDPGWPRAFRAEAARIAAVAPGISVQHIGSTSVPGLAAKPIIDMLGEVTNLAEADGATAALEALGYEACGEHGIPARRYFRRLDGTRATHHLHVFEAGSDGAHRHVAVRDYLRRHPREALAYAAEKRRAAAFADYQDAKSAFVAALEKRALAWAGKPRVVASLNDETEQRCVDIRLEAGAYAWVECRRDPEDGYGWRLTGRGAPGFASEAEARAAALLACPWAGQVAEPQVSGVDSPT